jgi:hypothetical protein
MPHSSPPGDVKRGETLHTIAIFAGATPDPRGNGKIEMKFKILRPDGTVYGEGTFVAWDKAVQPAPLLQLVETYPAVKIEQTDPTGVYQLQVTLTDKLANKTVSLALPFEVVEK